MKSFENFFPIGMLLLSISVISIEADNRYTYCQENNGWCQQICANLVPMDEDAQCSCYVVYKQSGPNCTATDGCLVEYGGCELICTSTYAGWQCSCSPGYQLDTDETSCNDINECATNNGGCAETCTNTDGSFRCSCTGDFNKLAADGKSCETMDGCLVENGGCEQICTSNEAGWQCSCHPGYQLDTDGTSCNDINECATNNGCCAEMCTNTVGSFRCSCTGDFNKLAADGKSCETTCPDTFVKSDVVGACYKLAKINLNTLTSRIGIALASMTVQDANARCKVHHKDAHLAAIADNPEKLKFLIPLVKKETDTCIWRIQSRIANNFSCQGTKFGYICEINLPKKTEKTEKKKTRKKQNKENRTVINP